MYLLEKKEAKNRFSYKKEINDHEFYELIGKMNKKKYSNTRKRDIYLIKYGKKLFKKHPLYKKKNKINFAIEREISVLTEDDILSLLTPVNKPKFYFLRKLLIKIRKILKNICEWKLIININNIEYKLGLNGIEIYRHIYKDITTEEYYKLLKEMEDIQKSDIPVEERVEKTDLLWEQVHKKEKIK